MRFSAPRSVSPSPVRGYRKPRHASTFGLQSDSDSEDYDSELDSSFDSTGDDDTASIASSSSSSSSSFSLIADINKMSLRPRHITRTPLEERHIEDTIAAIRLRTRYHDPYEEWEKQTRIDAFKTARKEYSATEARLQEVQERSRAEEEKRLAALHLSQAESLQRTLKAASLQQQNDDNRLLESWKQRDQQLWQRIENAIKMEQDKLAKRLEEERKIKEEEERTRREAELKRRLQEEKLLQAETAKRQAEEEKKKQEEEELRKEKEGEENLKLMAEMRERRAGEEVELRKLLGFNHADDDWRVARENLHNLKAGPIRHVKANKDLKAEWGKLRRQIVPKIGQLTNDPQAISRISSEIIEIIRPSNGPAHQSTIYVAACYSLAKSILLQAETEVTVEKRSAIPLAQVTFDFLETLEHFPSIFFAKLVQRCGGWPIPIVVPLHDHAHVPWPDKLHRIKAMGHRKSNNGEGLETPEEYSNRISGIMRLYFHILKIRPVRQPLNPMFQLPRYWTWFARLTADKMMLEHSVAPQLIYTALDVLGLEAKDIWGQQWIKLLALIYDGITTGYEDGKLIGGIGASGSAARTRVMLALERIMSGVQS
ncbi:GLE1-like protein-domain-containing protein [Crassisporium funariophilum]|nr:GLE1-like protein-domain-containing protein [Crassisporium funariophilum]